jgi:peptidoglycan/LPS O-acetylase OafA/YrhL
MEHVVGERAEHGATRQDTPGGGAVRVPVLDGLRGVAVLLVLAVHLTVLESAAVVDRMFTFVAFLGWIGVDLFFVLSGFLITGILYDGRHAAHYYRNFYVRRSLRIFPLYYVVCFVTLVMAPSLALAPVLIGPAPLRAEWSYWVYLSNFAAAAERQLGTGVLIVAWSLAIEEQFYALWAPVVHRVRPRVLVRLCVGLVAAAAFLRAALVTVDTAPVAVYVLPFARMDALALGALVALLIRQQGVHALVRPALLVGPCAALLVVGTALWDQDPTWRGTATQTVGYTANALMFASLVVVSLAGSTSRIGHVLASGWLRTFGKYSYALYLLHLPIRALVRDHVYGPDQFASVLGSDLPGQLLFYGVSTAAALLTAWCSWHLLEKHFLRLKTLFPMASSADSFPMRG